MMNIIKKLYYKREIRFLFVGGLNTIVGYALYAFFLYLGIHYFIANTFATILGVIHSYLWNRYFTFQSKEKAFQEFIKFSSVYLVSYCLGSLTLFVFVQLVHFNQYLAGLFNLICTTLISWFGHKYFSFRSVKNEKNK